jgi:hypothetical protein
MYHNRSVELHGEPYIHLSHIPDNYSRYYANISPLRNNPVYQPLRNRQLILK